MNPRVDVHDHEPRRGWDPGESRYINAGVWIDGVLRATLARSHYGGGPAELRAIPAERIVPRWRGALRAVIYTELPDDDAARIVLNNLALFPRAEAATLRHPQRKESE